MRRVPIAARGLVAAVVLCFLGAGSAEAMSYGPLTASHNGVAQGKGYGSFTRYGFNQGKLVSTLADLHKDGTRTFSSAHGYGSNDYLAVQSGRRDDGGSTYADMQTKYGTAAGSTLGFIGYVKVCQDVSLAPDWCSSESSGPM